MIYEKAEQIMNKTKDIPYPKVEYVDRNPYYATLLYDDFASNLGELSAITQYIYEHIDNASNSDLSRIMLDIAIEEMHHLDILGELIKRSGKKPYFMDSRGKLWSANNLKYDLPNLVETMKSNIYSENKAIEGYMKAIKNTRNMGIRKILNRIIIDEKKHIEVFEYILSTLE